MGWSPGQPPSSGPDPFKLLGLQFQMRSILWVAPLTGGFTLSKMGEAYLGVPTRSDSK